MVIKWRDKKDICLLSTVHNTEKVRTDKTDKDGNNIMKPKIVVDYNKTMRGVDHLDQKDGGKKDNVDFRLTIVERLIEAYHCESRTTKLGRPKKPGPLRLTERPFPDFIPPTEKKSAPTRCCAVCRNQRDEKGKKRRKETRYYCQPCNVGLCAVPCFKNIIQN